MKGFKSTLHSFDYNINKEDERDKSSSGEEINLLISESSEKSQSDSEVVILPRKKRKAPLISESSKESQMDGEVVNPKRKKKTLLINETLKLENDSEVVNPKRKTKPLLINETQEGDRFVTDDEYDIAVEK